MRVVSDPSSQATSAAALKSTVVAKQQPPVSLDEAKATGNATVKISSAALAKAAEPDMDHAKVARLKGAIDSGTYSVDSRQIAARILEED